MGRVHVLHTQTETYWRDSFEVSQDDLDLATGIVLHAGSPQPVSMLVSALVVQKFRREREQAVRQIQRGSIYRPMDEYEVGQDIVFSALDTVGKVVSVRAGSNPKYGAFSVARVALEDPPGEREFVAGFDHPHPLNRPVEDLVATGDADVSEEDLVRLYAPLVTAKLEAALEADDDFVRFGGNWFLTELLPVVHIGYLNLAEAMIYEARHPLPARNMLGELEIEGTGSADAQMFALNHALAEDERFDNLSATGEPVWYLRALEPDAVFDRPRVLDPAWSAVGGEYVGITMLDMIDDIGDQLDDIPSTTPNQDEELSMALSFPHLYAGTLPATQRFLRTLSGQNGSHFPITMIDSARRQQFDVWVVPDKGYICGFSEWFAAVGMCVGGLVTLAATDTPMTYEIGVASIRSRRSEWLRAATVTDDGLLLQMQRAAVAVRCDRNLLIEVPDLEAVARSMEAEADLDAPIGVVVRRAFQELAKLSSRGIVHAKSIYSVVNVMRRSGAVPVFAELTRFACFDPVGDGFWAYDPSLNDAVYQTPEEMLERPLSTRDDLARDQVVQYVGR